MTGPTCSLSGCGKEGVQALAEDWEHFISRIAVLGDERLLAPTGMGPGGWADETCLKPRCTL
ncbi:hypothetical protein [Streptomyces sp. NPDC017435]|uniref:hypothetical protein n=1 Tax=Streptomyces sp. NPDC017435 TaxID=3364995 RepID=UPI003788D8DC